MGTDGDVAGIPAALRATIIPATLLHGEDGGRGSPFAKATEDKGGGS